MLAGEQATSRSKCLTLTVMPNMIGPALPILKGQLYCSKIYSDRLQFENLQEVYGSCKGTSASSIHGLPVFMQLPVVRNRSHVLT